MTAAWIAWFVLAWLVVGALALILLTTWALDRPFVDRDPAWDCADDTDYMLNEEQP